MSDEQLISEFKAGTLEPFHHSDHVRMAWLYLQNAPVLEAMANFTADLKQFAIARGAPNLYHETITWGYLLLIHERMARTPGLNWEAFVIANADLMSWEKSVLKTYYRAETLQSEFARRVFVFPDNGTQSLA